MKQKTKQLLSILLSLCLLLSITAGLDFSAFADDDYNENPESHFTYTITDGKATITSFDRNVSTYDIVIPSTLGGYPVTCIGDNAFKNPWITSVTIPNTVTSIGEWAFSSCDRLEAVTIPDSVTSMGLRAFYWCLKLEKTYYTGTIDQWVEIDFGTEAPRLCDFYINNELVTSAEIKTAAKINPYAFFECTSITSITIPNTVTSIGDGAFYGCKSLKSISIPKDLTSIGEEVFKYCSGLTDITVDADNEYYSSADGVLFDKAKANLIQYPIGSTCSSYTIPDGVENINAYAFHSCPLSDLTIPGSVTSIGYGAFENCTGIIHTNYTGTVEQWAEINFDGGWSSCPTCYSKDLYINDKLLTDVELKAATKISPYAFYNCKSITSLIAGDTVTEIGNSAFVNCESLKSAVLSDSVEIIGKGSFEKCTSLTSITIPNSVTEIGWYAFSDCCALTDVYYSGTKDEWNSISISSSGNSCLFNAKIHYNSTSEPTPEPEEVFADIKGYDAYADYITYTSINNSFIKGTNPPYYTEFSPTTAITRAMFVTILYRMAGAPYDEANPHTTTPFTDITNTGVYYYNAACWALDNGITTQKTFKPNDLVVREQTASFLFRYASNEGFVDDSYTSVDLSKYSDLGTVSSWAVPAMQWANQQGMITGTQQGTLNPKGSTLRIHATKILYGFGMACGIGNM